MSFKAVVIIVSDTCYKDNSQDKTFPKLRELLESSSYKATLDFTPDDKLLIQQTVLRHVASNDLIITSGGTGFGVRDVTPEAVKALLDKEANGLAQAMLNYGMTKTNKAILSRPVAGVIGNSIVITLPGSSKGAVENLEGIIDVLHHAVRLAKGTDSRALHAQPDKPISEPVHGCGHHHGENHNAGHTHSHGHGSHGPVRHELTSAAQRPRESPYPMVPVPEALELIKEKVPQPLIVTVKLSSELVGYVLAEDVYASCNVPNNRTSILDGYAVYHDDCPSILPVELISHASPNGVKTLARGSVARVTTGAPVPDGATAVIGVEETLVASTTDDGKEEKSINVLAKNVSSGDNIREIGSDIKKGTLVLPKGTFLSGVGGELGMLASVGVSSVKVYRKPVVGILSTGNEVVDVPEGRDLVGGEIWDSNRPTLLALVRQWGFEAVDLGIVSDDPDLLERALYGGHDNKSGVWGVDVVITSGGVSMGELDLVKPIINKVGGRIHFGRVAMKPGKPTTFATLPVAGTKQDKVIFGLPGNPASASATFHIFVLPALRKMSGSGLFELSKLRVKLSTPVALDSRPEYHRVVLSQLGSDMIATSTGGQRSSRIGSFKGANGLLCLPSSKDVNKTKLEAGDFVEALVIGQI